MLRGRGEAGKSPAAVLSDYRGKGREAMTGIAELMHRLSVGLYVIGGRVLDPSAAPMLYRETADMDGNSAPFRLLDHDSQNLSAPGRQVVAFVRHVQRAVRAKAHGGRERSSLRHTTSRHHAREISVRHPVEFADASRRRRQRVKKTAGTGIGACG